MSHNDGWIAEPVQTGPTFLFACMILHQVPLVWSKTCSSFKFLFGQHFKGVNVEEWAQRILVTMYSPRESIRLQKAAYNMQINVFCNPGHAIWDGIWNSVKENCDTAYVTPGEIQEIICTARLNVQTYQIKHIKIGKENVCKPKSGFWSCEEWSFLSLLLRTALVIGAFLRIRKEILSFIF